MAQSTPNWPVLQTFTFTNGPDVDRSVWQSPTGNAAYFGRTQIRNSQLYGSGGAVPVTNNAAQLPLSTYNSLAPGASFLGSQISTIQTWGLADYPNGIAFEAEIVCPVGMPGGAVTALFSYNLLSAEPFIHDEIDFEFASNYWSANEALNTNVYVASNDGIDQVINTSINFSAVNTFRIQWTSASVIWYVNGTAIRSSTSVPQSDMALTLNFWVPDSSWGWAYNGSLQPSGSPGSQWAYQVNSATVYGASSSR